MQVSNYSLEHLPFSDLFKTYIQDFQQLAEFYVTNPFDEKAIAQKIDRFQFDGDRHKTIEILTAFNKQFDVHQATLDNLDRLKDENALTIVTGQQLGIYGGPLYTVLKTISVIHLAEKLERKYDRPVIPVFWLADEDHDYDEVRKLHLLDNKDETDKVESFELPPKDNHSSPVARMQLSEALKRLRGDLKETLYNTDFSDDLWDLLDTSYTTEHTFFEAFGLFISRLFSKRGLVLAGSNNSEVKKLVGGYIKESILRVDEIRRNLEEQSNKIGAAYHQQVTLYDSNLFYLDKKEGRVKINHNGSGWKTDAGREWEAKQLIGEIEQNPERFSPNVFLRPILQDALLPTLGYVAGPGEIAYYGQMKSMYSSFDLEMPIIFPRLSATFLEPSIDRIMNELPFEFHEYAHRIEDLETDYVDRTEQRDIKALFDEWKEKFENLAAPRKEEITDIDPTLEGAVEKASASYCNELDKLESKVYRAIKKQDQIQLRRIRRIKANLFPGDGLQERVIAGIFYMNKYGIDIWDELLNALDDDEQFDHHKLIYC